jgi:hypothetical protein
MSIIPASNKPLKEYESTDTRRGLKVFLLTGAAAPEVIIAAAGAAGAAAIAAAHNAELRRKLRLVVIININFW